MIPMQLKIVTSLIKTFTYGNQDPTCMCSVNALTNTFFLLVKLLPMKYYLFLPCISISGFCATKGA